MLVGEGEPAALEPHDHVVLDTDDGWHVRFNDARRFGLMDLVAAPKLDRHRFSTGWVPSRSGHEFDGAAPRRGLKGKATPIKAALLDQRVVAGLGNIYVSEALFWAGISPRRLARTVQGERANRLAAAIKQVLEDGDRGRRLAPCATMSRPTASSAISSIAARSMTARGSACPGCDCGAPAARPRHPPHVQAGRSTFYCARRQR